MKIKPYKTDISGAHLQNFHRMISEGYFWNLGEYIKWIKSIFRLAIGEEEVTDLGIWKVDIFEFDSQRHAQRFVGQSVEIPHKSREAIGYIIIDLKNYTGVPFFEKA